VARLGELYEGWIVRGTSSPAFAVGCWGDPSLRKMLCIEYYSSSSILDLGAALNKSSLLLPRTFLSCFR
jgi:hypothetical protein